MEEEGIRTAESEIVGSERVMGRGGNIKSVKGQMFFVLVVFLPFMVLLLPYLVAVLNKK